MKDLQNEGDNADLGAESAVDPMVLTPEMKVSRRQAAQAGPAENQTANLSTYNKLEGRALARQM